VHEAGVEDVAAIGAGVGVVRIRVARILRNVDDITVAKSVEVA
jgi:hypothetical protein